MTEATGNPAPRQPSNKLKLPAGVASTGPVMDLADAYMRAVVALPEHIEALVDELSVLALYFERRGIKEELFTKEELMEGPQNEKPDGDSFAGN